MIVLQIGYPPSTNRIWRNYRGRTVLSEQYREWREREGWNIIAAQNRGGISGPYRLEIDAVRPDRRRRDLGNLEKPISDLLVSVGVIDDDSNAQEIRMRWVESGPPIVVRIEKAGVA